MGNRRRVFGFKTGDDGMLNYGNCCKERCLTVKVYKTVETKKRVEFCINKGCGYKRELFFITKEEK